MNFPMCKESEELAETANRKSPFVHCFKTDKYNFVLDLHTNKLFSISSSEAEVIKKWLAGTDLTTLSTEYPKEADEIKGLREQGLFCCQSPQGLAFGIDWDEIQNDILHKREHTVFELTNRCNLRCKYCTFGGGFKDHTLLGSRIMNEQLAKDTAISALEHGSQLDSIAFGFYGGEPLVAFELLKKIVLFIRERAGEKEIRFSITTNATLIDKDKARFLYDAGFSLLVSLDGPRYMHDRYRVFPGGKGSYNKAIQGLKTLLDVYPPDEHDRIAVNMVVPSPGWYSQLERLWDNEPWLPRALRTQINIVDPPQGLHIPPPPSVDSWQSMKETWLSHVNKREECQLTLNSDIFDMPMAFLHQRGQFNGQRQTFFPNGCCIPATRKLFVRVDGTYQICERAHGVPPIGSVARGVDLVKIKELIEEYCRLSFIDCKGCIAISTCSICFEAAYESNQFSLERKRRRCANMKNSLAAKLETYGFIAKKHPYKLKEWDAVTIT